MCLKSPPLHGTEFWFCLTSVILEWKKNQYMAKVVKEAVKTQKMQNLIHLSSRELQ